MISKQRKPQTAFVYILFGRFYFYSFKKLPQLPGLKRTWQSSETCICELHRFVQWYDHEGGKATIDELLREARSRPPGEIPDDFTF